MMCGVAAGELQGIRADGRENGPNPKPYGTSRTATMNAEAPVTQSFDLGKIGCNSSSVAAAAGPCSDTAGRPLFPGFAGGRGGFGACRAGLGTITSALLGSS